MESFAQHPDAAKRSTVFLEPEQMAELNPAVRGEVTGGLHCADDAVVEPRLALAALRGYLKSTPGYALYPKCRIVAVEEQGVRDTSGRRWDADIVIVATGAAFDHLPGASEFGSNLRRVRLQMFETAPFGHQLTTSVADADSLRYYPAYEVVDRQPLGRQTPVAEAHQMQLLLVQRLDGGLTIGDTHAHEEPFDFALVEDPTDELLRKAADVLGQAVPPVTRRWEGVYSQCVDGGVCARHELAPGVWMVTGPGGRGMTCAPAIAADTLTTAGIA
jgi:glycine/D-amino acid oxidase-like deaminating enzyme